MLPPPFRTTSNDLHPRGADHEREGSRRRDGDPTDRPARVRDRDVHNDSDQPKDRYQRRIDRTRARVCASEAKTSNAQRFPGRFRTGEQQLSTSTHSKQCLRAAPVDIRPAHAPWRSPSRATEDRNNHGRDVRTGQVPMAVALTGGRGSQHLRSRSVECHPRGGGPSGRPRIATGTWWRSPSTTGSGGRPQGRLRIATGRRCSGKCRGSTPWRSPLRAAEEYEADASMTQLKAEHHMAKRTARVLREAGATIRPRGGRQL
ncbi:hypothetical protein NG2371_06799 [Nocardia gamkensis]|nr:hypothetical protein [Nocardia gamkensis]